MHEEENSKNVQVSLDESGGYPDIRIVEPNRIPREQNVRLLDKIEKNDRSKNLVPLISIIVTIIGIIFTIISVF